MKPIKKSRYSFVAVLASVALLGAACSDDDSDDSAATDSAEATVTEAESSDESSSDTDDMTIVDIASGNEDLSTLVTALTAGRSGRGPLGRRRLDGVRTDQRSVRGTARRARSTPCSKTLPVPSTTFSRCM